MKTIRLQTISIYIGRMHYLRHFYAYGVPLDTSYTIRLDSMLKVHKEISDS